MRSLGVDVTYGHGSSGFALGASHRSFWGWWLNGDSAMATNKAAPGAEVRINGAASSGATTRNPFAIRPGIPLIAQLSGTEIRHGRAEPTGKRKKRCRLGGT